LGAPWAPSGPCGITGPDAGLGGIGLSTEREMSGRLTQHVVAACTGSEPG
jgi:hypothetical protein